MKYQRGKKAAQPLPAKAFLFSEIFHAKAPSMPVPPAVFGHQALVEAWHMLGNDEFGNCVWAAKAHMHMLWSLLGSNVRDRFTTFDVLSDYGAQTGFKATDPSTDQGTDMQAAAEYHRLIGVRDATNTRRKVTAYVALEPRNNDQLALATYLFGAVEIGVMLPADCDDLFDQGKVWTVTKSKPTGGHTVCIVGRDADGNFLAVTWGKLQRIAPAFLHAYMDEGYAYLNDEILNLKGLSVLAYDKPTLARMLSHVSTSTAVHTDSPVSADEVEADAPEALATILSPTPTPVKPAVPTQAQYDIAFKILRADVDKSGYGWMMADATLRTYTDAVTLGIVRAGITHSTAISTTTTEGIF